MFGDAFCSVVAELEESESGSLGSLISCCRARAALEKEDEVETGELGDTSRVVCPALVLNPVLASYVITALLT